ncbi:hypothetical protein Goklo_002817 [Gossypium klotzschianum]|uniref:Uncharacterized protein n=1 Tax=Gossypium klotzschianum TaxID=34286 RepID=A0A7J8VUC4_9ROSI|nr:hypothetical protein [Gossypium klotzschianum]
MTEFVLVILRDRVEEERRFLNKEKDPMTSKELNDEPYEVKISFTILVRLITSFGITAYIPGIGHN